MDRKKGSTVLFLGSLEHAEEPDKCSDEIDFNQPVRILLIRIPRMKR